MNIDIEKSADQLLMKVSGRVDTMTAPELDKAVKDNLGSVPSLVIDFGELDYISSAGLRVLLAAQKTMNKQGTMVVQNVKPAVMDVFDVTGFSNILTIR